MSDIHTFLLDGSLELVMPLFGPIREKEWEPHWNPTIVYTDSELADSKGTIFAVTYSDGTKSVWYVNQFDYDAQVIEYLRVESGYQFVQILIHFQKVNKTQTQVEVIYQFTTLSEAGNTKLANIREIHAKSMLSWQPAINRRLETISK